MITCHLLFRKNTCISPSPFLIIRDNNMEQPRLISRPSFEIIGKKTWISGQDNEIFVRFWNQCREEGLFGAFHGLTGMQPGAQTGGVTLGVSCVEADPANRDFYYFIAVEAPDGVGIDGLERHRVPAAEWAVFEACGQMPDALVAAEMFAFMEWLPASAFEHAAAPEMEVYPPQPENDRGDVRVQFWLPVRRKAA
jgi:AraC family transcriptional regulator